jgi:hypothetical protein
VTRKQLNDPEWQPQAETEFKLQAYMALYHLNPHSGSKVTDEDEILRDTTARLEDFKKYLNQHASEFMQEDRFAQYFNIPFVLSINTEEHEEFRQFFRPQWKKEIEGDMKAQIEEMLTTNEPEGSGDESTQKEGGKTKTQLEKMLRFFVKENSKNFKGEPNMTFEDIENRAEEVAAEIEKSKGVNKQKMKEVSAMASSYENVKEDYENYLSELEDKKKTEICSTQGFILVENKYRRDVLDDRDKAETEALKNFQKELGRKLSIQETRIFKTQFKERFNNSRVISYALSQNKDHLLEDERIWKRILFEQAQNYYTLSKSKLAPPTTTVKGVTPKPIHPDEVSRLDSSISLINSTFEASFQKVNAHPDTLKSMLEGMKLGSSTSYDKRYKLDDDFLESCIVINKKPQVPVQAAQPGLPDDEDINMKGDTNTATTQPTRKIYPEDIHERTAVALALINQKLKESPDYKVPMESQFFDQVWANAIEQINSMIANPTSPILNHTEIELSLKFICTMVLKNEEYLGRLKRGDALMALYFKTFTFADQQTSVVVYSNKAY